MTPPQSKKDKWFMRSKDIVLFLLGSGGIVYGLLVSGVDISKTPGQVKELSKRFDTFERSAYAMDKRLSIMETNFQNQADILKEIKEGQNRMWRRYGGFHD